MSEELEFWNREAGAFDDEPDHGLKSAATRQRWSVLLARLLHGSSGPALDIGCGTGSLSLLLAELGFAVTGIDFSPAMLAKAKAKAAMAGVNINFDIQDAAAPLLPSSRFNVIVCRHVLWALDDTSAVLRRWSDLLQPGGRMVLVEGFWHTGAGLRARDVLLAMPDTMGSVVISDLAKDLELWGRPIDDERYAVSATRLPISA